MISGEIRVNGIPAGRLEETETGFQFQYYRETAQQRKLPAVSLTLPKRTEPHESPVLFPFFAGLLTEGVAMQLQCRMLKLDEDDLFGPKTGRRTSAVVRKEKETLGAPRYDQVASFRPICGLLGHVDRQRPCGDRLAGKLDAMDRSIPRGRLDVVRRRATVRVPANRHGCHPVREC